MTKARISVLGLLASAGMLYGCATDDQAASALTNAANVATVETATAATPAIVDNFMLPDETLMGHELYRLADAKAVVIITQANGCPIFNPHRYTLEEGGMKQTDEIQLAFKQEADPKGLLNPGKMIAWENPDFDFNDGKTYLFPGLVQRAGAA